ncbi:hypothetical protein COLO4_38116 [Corchorus olitorius]|uniref:Uncharacterized protein n=1 Tax=Corchorus olitorius TaxID=93759 RepID=A0A1R3FWY2_9ROSI|nr:hypothetical protein COLO4_38116 [Corchorus olitorius]
MLCTCEVPCCARPIGASARLHGANETCGNHFFAHS